RNIFLCLLGILSCQWLPKRKVRTEGEGLLLPHRNMIPKDHQGFLGSVPHKNLIVPFPLLRHTLSTEVHHSHGAKVQRVRPLQSPRGCPFVRPSSCETHEQPPDSSGAFRRQG